jgi:glyoxylase-like metal-dependent hydrolase (beta-lactamase superfamily II)
MSGRLLVGEGQEWTGGGVSPLAWCVLAPNPSAWTLDGTNTWIVGEEGDRCVVVDPGPLANGHEAAILERVAERNSRITAVLLTHGHWDHAEGAQELADRVGVPVFSWAAGTLRPADRFDIGGGDLRVIATPGHTSDSVCFLVGDALLTGDTVLGRGTSVVAHPDGRLGDYLASLQTLARLCHDEGIDRLLPGHGPVIDQPAQVVDYYLRHRQERLQQVRDAMRAGATTVEEITDRVYWDVPVEVRRAAEATVSAQVAYLEEVN